MLQIQNVSKRYIGVRAVDDVSFSLGEGKLAALLGPNGSGKTTLMKAIAGLTRPDSGSITFEGLLIGAQTKRDICYMPTENYFYPYMTVRDAGRYYADFFSDFSLPRYEELVQQDELDEKRKVRSLSSGMMAKVKLDLAFARQSKLTMLDEPLNGIDILARENTLSLIRSHKGTRTMLVSSHLVDELEDSLDVLLFMKKGKLVLAGDKDELCRNGKTVVDLYKEVYGGEVRENG